MAEVITKTSHRFFLTIHYPPFVDVGYEWKKEKEERSKSKPKSGKPKKPDKRNR